MASHGPGLAPCPDHGMQSSKHCCGAQLPTGLPPQPQQLNATPPHLKSDTFALKVPAQTPHPVVMSSVFFTACVCGVGGAGGGGAMFFACQGVVGLKKPWLGGTPSKASAGCKLCAPCTALLLQAAALQQRRWQQSAKRRQQPAYLCPEHRCCPHRRSLLL